MRQPTPFAVATNQQMAARFGDVFEPTKSSMLPPPPLLVGARVVEKVPLFERSGEDFIGLVMPATPYVVLCVGDELLRVHAGGRMPAVEAPPPPPLPL